MVARLGRRRAHGVLRPPHGTRDGDPPGRRHAGRRRRVHRGEEVAVDAFDEWLELGSLPQLFDIHPEQRELLGPGRTLHFHATDTGPQARAEWLVDLTGETVVWRRAHEKAAVAVRGPLTELLLVLYRRRSPHSEGIEVLGDGQLLDFWQERVGFG